MFKFSEQQFKDLMWGVGIVGFLLLLVLTVSSLWDVFAKTGVILPPGSSERVVTLSAQGSAFAAPDTARFTVSVVTQGNTPETVEQENAERMNAVIEYLKGEGVEAEDIKTVAYNLNPQYDFNNGQQTLVGYELRQTAEVRTKELGAVGGLLSGAISAGANEVSSISLFIEDPDAVREQARAEAIAKIEEKKEAMQRDLGVRLGKVVNVAESSDGGFIPPIPFAERGLGGAADDAVASSIEPGSQEVFVNVTITYQIR
jgi:uncharacterized protein YggE